VAKEIIALANHGGGYLVVGYAELADGSFAPANPRPADLIGWSQDSIQSIVAKYIDPAVQCRIVHRMKPGTTDRYPIIVVPGGHRVPIRAKAGSPNGKLVPNRVCIRRPGPKSEEPQTAEEWDRLLERCLQNRKAELLEAMRSIMEGVVPSAPATIPSRSDDLRDFEKSAVGRWNTLVEKLPATAAPRFLHGCFDVGIAIDGDFERPTIGQLSQIIRTEVRSHSGWPSFLTLDRAPFAHRPVDGAVEFWRGPDQDGSYHDTAHSDFWRIAPEGFFFTRRGYVEDSKEWNLVPGKSFDITNPTWRVGDAIAQTAYIAKALRAADANLICHCRWTGLAGRQLISRWNPRRTLFDGRYKTEQDCYEVTKTLALDAFPAALPELVFAILAPLYELFDFFQLPKRLVDEELTSLLSNRF
jgi:hypothetical protein